MLEPMDAVIFIDIGGAGEEDKVASRSYLLAALFAPFLNPLIGNNPTIY